jgi:hypothetical protein
VNNRRNIDAVTTAAPTTLTSASGAFVAGDVGRTIVVWNMGTASVGASSMDKSSGGAIFARMSKRVDTCLPGVALSG